MENVSLLYWFCFVLRIDNGDLEHMCTQLRVFYDILGI